MLYASEVQAAAAPLLCLIAFVLQQPAEDGTQPKFLASKMLTGVTLACCLSGAAAVSHRLMVKGLTCNILRSFMSKSGQGTSHMLASFMLNVNVCSLAAGIHRRQHLGQCVDDGLHCHHPTEDRKSQVSPLHPMMVPHKPPCTADMLCVRG